MCGLNETLYTCTEQHQCCQSQSEALVDQLQSIKEKFQGVDDVIRNDYGNIEGIVRQGLVSARANITSLLSPHYSLLLPHFNSTLYNLYKIYIGFGRSDTLSSSLRDLPSLFLQTVFTKPSDSTTLFPRTVKGIGIFWELNSVQRQCVVDYLIDMTELGVMIRETVGVMRTSTESLHQYMSLLGSMVRIIQDMAEAQETENCIEEIVAMQQCSLCSKTPVCPSFYEQLLSGCVPALEDLYSRWESLMSAMSELTLRLCDNDLTALYSTITDMADFVKRGRVEEIVYLHGILAYMRCVQPDSHKRSVARDMGRSEEFMVPEKQEEEEITPRTPKQLPVDDYVYHAGSGNGLDDIRLPKRSVPDELEPTTSFTAHTVTPTQEVDPLPECREKLGLSFPPLDLGTSTLLNISISDFDINCWNGNEIGRYVLDDIASASIGPRPEALAIKELDEKMCRYTKSCHAPKHKPLTPHSSTQKAVGSTQVLASLVASLYYCCC